MRKALQVQFSSTPVCIDKEQPELQLNEPKIPKRHGAAVIKMTDAPTSHKADAFTNRDDINCVITYLLEHRQYGKAALFTFGINTGYRCGDIIAFRVKDFYDEKGDFRNVFYIVEDKTNRARATYVNKAARTAVELVIKKKRLTSNNYVFRGDGNRKAYITGFRYNKDGEIEDVLTSGEPLDEHGVKREIAPMLVGSVGRWLKNLSADLGIYGHFSSHAMRHTFSAFTGQGYDNNWNAAAACMALGHSDPSITAKYYSNVDPAKMREKCLTMNLGLEAYERFLEDDK